MPDNGREASTRLISDHVTAQASLAAKQISRNRPTVPLQGSATAAEPVGLSIGDTIGDAFRIEAVYPGGMGIVYRVTKIAGDGVFAAKTLKDTANPELRERFESEALNWIALPLHDNIVSAIELFVDGGRPFLLMEFVDGGSLAERLRPQPMLREAAIDLACQLCIGMADLSGFREIAHLDLKPANLMLTRDGTLRITDFGLSRITTAFDSQPAFEKRGTMRYASPEQYLQEVVDTRSDIFSFGVLFYQLLTGAFPYPMPLTGDDNRDNRGFTCCTGLSAGPKRSPPKSPSG